jgi:eukaryotic-like serine/threonine-protein kinase
MSHPNSVSQEANALGPLLEKRKMSRRTLLRNMAGLALTGGSLTPLATACGFAPGTSAASQSSTSAAQGTSIFTYRGHGSGVNAAAWSPDGKRIASGSDDDTVQVWEALTGNPRLTYRGHSDVVNTVAWSPDSQRLASGSDDDTVQIWEVTTRSTIFTYRGHTNSVLAVAWSPDGKRIVSGSKDGTTQVWQAQ